MRRRSVVIGGTSALVAGTAMVGPGSATAPTSARVGWLAGSAGPLPTPAYLEAMRKGLEERGWREGVNLQLEQRWGDRDSAPRLARELLARKPDVLAAQGAMVLGVRELGIAVPTVFGFSGDPVEAKLVASFARPGGTFTGIAMQSLELVGKRLEILQQFRPSLGKVGIIANPAHPGEQLELKASLAAAGALGLRITYVPVTSGSDFDVAFRKLLADGVEALVAFPDALVMSQAKIIAAFQRAHRIPAISGWSEFADDGNLSTYGPNLRATWQQAASFVDRILRGAKPSELPVEQPSAFELVVNAKAAAELGLAIPQIVALRTDRMIR